MSCRTRKKEGKEDTPPPHVHSVRYSYIDCVDFATFYRKLCKLTASVRFKKIPIILQYQKSFVNSAYTRCMRNDVFFGNITKILKK